MIKKVLYAVSTVLEAICLLGAFAVQYFTRKKMGMARYVLYKNRGWESVYPMEILAKAIPLLMAAMTAALFFYFLRRRKGASKVLWRMNKSLIVLTLVYVGFSWMNSSDGLRAYYFISALLGASCLIQWVKTWVGIRVCRHEA